METLALFASQFMYILTNPLVLGGVLAGVTLGIFIGAIPGITGTMGMALLIPMTFTFPPEVAIPMLAAVYKGAQYGGAIPAILINTPGTGSAAATCFDGYPMAQQGHAGKALGIALYSSATGGFLGVIALTLFTPQLASFAIRFGPAQYFGLAIFGLSVITSVSSRSLSKGLLSAMIGLFLAVIGMDNFVGISRYTFGYVQLRERIDFIPVLIGVFAFAEVFKNSAFIKQKAAEKFENITKPLPWREFLPLKWTAIHSSVIGIVLGALPGAGATTASFIAYNETVRFSKTPEKFGTGMPEGIVASEASDNAASCGALIPLLALGIPGSATTAIMLGAFQIHGIQPGPRLFSGDISLVYTIFLGLLIANFAMIAIGLVGVKFFARMALIPYSILGPFILVLGTIGAFAIRRNPLDIWVLLVFGVVGFIFDRQGIPKVPMIIAMVLGPIAESSFRRALMLHRGSFVSVISDPITFSLVLLAAISFTYPFIRPVVGSLYSSIRNKAGKTS